MATIEGASQGIRPVPRTGWEGPGRGRGRLAGPHPGRGAGAGKQADLIGVDLRALNLSPVLLEPIMKVEIVVPEEFVGDVINDLNTRGGRIERITTKGPAKILAAVVPLSKMFGYSTALRSASQGRATFTMQFFRYDKV